MFPLLTTLPVVSTVTKQQNASGVSSDTGGYDISIGGVGFRFATDAQFPYTRTTEQATTQRVDTSNEPGEQTLAPLPWPKSQSSFHAGAGQLNLEQGTSAFEYQQERIDHYRFDTSLGIDPWTPGQVTRLPDMTYISHDLSGTQPSCAVAGLDANGHDCVMVGGLGFLTAFTWSGGIDSNPTIAEVDFTGADFGGSADNVIIKSLATDGVNYYASVALVVQIGTQNAYVIKGTMGSGAAPTVIYDCGTATGVVAWQKARLMGALGSSIYELDGTAAAHSALPTVAYTYPGGGWAWKAAAESPDGMLFAGDDGIRSLVIELGLTTTGGTPVLDGGTVVGRLPQGELIYSLEDLLASFLAIGTNKGIHLCTYDTYTGRLQINALSVTTDSPVYSLTSRDRLIYGTYTSQQEDGSTGLVAVDVSMVVDAGGRNAWAPSLRPPSGAVINHPTVDVVTVLPLSERVVFTTGDGLFLEGDGPGTDGDAFLRTSRIRYDTVEPKMFKLGLVRGMLASSQLRVVGILPYDTATNLGTFGFTETDPGEFQLTGLSEWLQLEIHLDGASCVFNTYQVKAYPAPRTSELITFTVNCFSSEVDRFNNSVNDPQTPRQRYQAVRQLKAIGDEVTLVEFTNTQPVLTKVMIDALQFRSDTPPSVDDDFGGYITFNLRTTEN